MLFVLYHKGSKSLEIDHTLKETAIDSFTCSAAFLHSDVGWSWGCVTLSHPEIWAGRSWSPLWHTWDVNRQVFTRNKAWKNCG